ncbi:hypothetical protein CCMA1212_009328 [Trichoderma ghanense]|uniref:Uncharacterized protein n=1 Tax=Trichoderma ghanense TaxID=65468 RepID=A0ABY2GS71_9HYPO
MGDQAKSRLSEAAPTGIASAQCLGSAHDQDRISEPVDRAAAHQQPRWPPDPALQHLAEPLRRNRSVR